MQIDLKSSKPVNARLISRIKINEKRQKEVMHVFNTTRQIVVAKHRLDETGFAAEIQRARASTNLHLPRNERRIASVAKLCAIFNSFNGETFDMPVNEALMSLMCTFYYGDNPGGTLFDRMLKFYKADVFRQLEVVK